MTGSKNTGRRQAQRMYEASQCARCGGTATLQRHHQDGNPLNNAPDNILILCQKCHTEEDMRTGRWGRGPVPQATCQICDKTFQPKRRRRSKLCGSPECKAKCGERAAAKRWSRES